MARKTVNRKELRAQSDAAEAREKTAKKATKEKAPKAKKEKAAKDPAAKAPAKKASRKKVAKEARMKAYWGVYTPAMKRLALFEYSDRKAAEKKAADLTASSRVSHFIQLCKEAITE